MGRAQREREAREKLQVGRYRVRRWTAFAWTETKADSRKDREEHLDRMAVVVERQMLSLFPDFKPRCRRARVDEVPQLLFELTLPATDKEDATRRAIYRCERALSAKLPQGMGRRVHLRPPWGAVEVEEAQERLHAVG